MGGWVNDSSGRPLDNMTVGKNILMICVALAAFLTVGVSCSSEQVAQTPATAVPESTTADLTSAPTATARPTATSVAASALGKSAAVVPARPTEALELVATGEVVSPDGAMTGADFPTPPARDLLQLARELRWDGVEPAPSPKRFAGQTLAVGDTAEFWILDYPRRMMRRKEFRLQAVSEHAYWWIEQGVKVDDDDLQRSVSGVEEQVYPRVTAVFGEPAALAGGDGRGHIINGPIPGVGGYVSGADPYPSAVQPYSNEVPAIYINADAVPLGSDEYLDVLAHELQHAIHWYADSSEDTWLNEGLSELAVTEAGFTPASMFYYLRRPNVSLVNWPDELGGDVGRNYGAGALFAHYLRERYAPEGDLQDLLAGQHNGITAIDVFLDERGAVTTGGEPADFHTLFADWMVANLLDREDVGYGYANLDLGARVTRTTGVGGDGITVSLAQYGIDYVELKDVQGEVAVHFEGAGETALLPVEAPEGGCWWTNRGDDISSTLTRSFSMPAAVSGGTESVLTFNLWYSIEEDWDYLYLEVSTDGGATWEVLSADGTTDANPLGNSYGHGYTGSSGWGEVTVSLTDYAGRDALVRFHYVTDDAIHGPGACLSDMRASWDADGDWEPDGFVWINNRVRQDWIVWLINDGPEPSAARIPLTWDTREKRHAGTVSGSAIGDGGRLVVAVAPTAPATMEPGQYRVWAKETR